MPLSPDEHPPDDASPGEPLLPSQPSSEGGLSAEPVERTVSADSAGQRLDLYLARQFPAYSRVLLRQAINAAAVQLNGRRSKAAAHVKTGDVVRIVLPDLPRPGPVAENIPLTIVYEDEWLAVIDKPAGMVVHPAKGHWSGTLAAALQFHFDELSEIGGPTRPGIVHRLDRDTSGLIVVARHDQAHQRLSDQFSERSIEKEYFALVAGNPDRDRDLIDKPIGAHPHQREKMAIRRNHSTSREAQSFYEVVARYRGFASVRIMPKTGRTHQIRVHLASIGCPVLCDRLYSGRARITVGELAGKGEFGEVILERQALHARRLSFAHPRTGERMEFESPLPEDIQRTLDRLRSFVPL